MTESTGIRFSGKFEDVNLRNRDPLDGILCGVQFPQTLKNKRVCQGVCTCGGKDAVRLARLSLRDQLPDAFSFARRHLLSPPRRRGSGGASWVIRFGLPAVVERLSAEGFQLVEDKGNVVVELTFPFYARGSEDDLRPSTEGPQRAPRRPRK